MWNFERVLDAITNAGIYIIEKRSHTIIYCNKRFKELVPAAEVSLGCYEIGMDICNRCPLESYDPAKKGKNVFLRESHVFGGMVEVSVDEILWEDKIPAYIVTIIPQMKAEETKNYYLYNRSIDRVVKKISVATVSLNLTKNISRSYIWNDKNQFLCEEEGSVDGIFADMLRRMHSKDRERCGRFDTCAKMEAYFNKGGKYLEDEMLIKGEDGRYRWFSLRVIPLEYTEYRDTLAVLVIRNIHTRKVLQVRTQNNLEATYKAIPGGVCTMRVDKNLSIISANEEFYRMMGETQADYENGYLEHIYPKDAERVSAYFHLQAERKADLEITYRVLDINGDVHWMQVKGIHCGKADGYPVYMLLRTDITLIIEAQRQIEEEQEKYRKYADNVIDTLSNLVEFRDLDSGEHIKRTKDLTRIMINTYNKKYPEHFIIDSSREKICRASALHDVGKISISDTILNKKGRLTDEEMEIMKTHTTKGYEIIRGFKLNDDEEQERYSLDIAKYHHERWDGKGYPEGLQGDEIPLWSQIVGIVDVYDALVSPRVYKKAFSHEKAMEMILAGECGTFNPILLECLKDAEELLKNEYK